MTDLTKRETPTGRAARRLSIAELSLAAGLGAALDRVVSGSAIDWRGGAHQSGLHGAVLRWRRRMNLKRAHLA